MNIKKVVVGLLRTNCYIVENDKECLIIDPGSDLKKIVSNINKKVVGILVTHNHFDHVGVLPMIKEYYNVDIYDYSNLKEGINSISSFKFIVRYNPGHTMDSISYIFDSVMFSGDFVFKGTIGRCDKGGDFYLMKESIKDLLECDINYEIFPGHGKSTYLFDEKRNLISFIDWLFLQILCSINI